MNTIVDYGNEYAMFSHEGNELVGPIVNRLLAGQDPLLVESFETRERANELFYEMYDKLCELVRHTHPEVRDTAVREMVYDSFRQHHYPTTVRDVERARSDVYDIIRMLERARVGSGRSEERRAKAVVLLETAIEAIENLSETMREENFR